MKILHTADWHAGRVLHGQPRTGEIREVLREIAELAQSEAVDLVLVAGDLYDTRNPGAEAEATVYFCVLEALQNAGKYAGEGAAVTVQVTEDAPTLTFTVSDDGQGFDPRAGHMGAGFTNMLDRLGALGGSLRVESAEGKGTRVVGLVPAQRLAG